MALKYLC